MQINKIEFSTNNKCTFQRRVHFFVFQYEGLCGKSWLFGAKIAHLQCGCQLVCQNSVFLTHVLRFCVFSTKKIGAKMLTKCVWNHAKTTGKWQQKYVQKTVQICTIQPPRNSAKICANWGTPTMQKLAQKWCKQRETFSRNKCQNYAENLCKTSKKCKKKSREISRLSFCCVDNYSASG